MILASFYSRYHDGPQSIMEAMRALNRRIQRMLSASKPRQVSHIEGTGPRNKRTEGLGPTLKLPFEILNTMMELSCDDTLCIAKWAVSKGLLTETAQRLLYGHLNEQSLQRMQRCISTEHARKGCK